MSRLSLLAAVLALLICLTGLSDTITLKNGRTLEGDINKITKDEISIDVSRGDLVATLYYPKSEVVKMEYGPAPAERLEEAYAERLVSVAGSTSADVWFALGDWAAGKFLNEKARAAFRRALKFDPNHADARRALGYNRFEGEWLTDEQIMTRKGFVRFEGNWITPKERDDLLAQRAENEKKQKAEAKARRKEIEELREEVARLKRKVRTRSRPIRFKQDYWPWYPNRVYIMAPYYIGPYTGFQRSTRSNFGTGLRIRGTYDEGSTRIEFRIGV